MVNCLKCNNEMENLFESDNTIYFHCEKCHTNYKDYFGNVSEIKKIVSIDINGKTSDITPGYSPLKRTNKTLNANNNEKLECLYCKRLKEIGKEYSMYLYTQLFLDDF